VCVVFSFSGYSIFIVDILRGMIIRGVARNLVCM